MDARIGIIDGTGPWSDVDYAHAMRHSFCRQIYDSPRLPHGHKHYIRGPWAEGSTTGSKADHLADWASSQRRASPGCPIYLSGYSRGAWGAIMAAEMLKARGVDVAALFLFDPVRMQGFPSGQTIPTNVEHVYIARRDYNNPTMDKYDWTASVLSSTNNPVRKWWGVTGLNPHGIPGKEEIFLGSHGALGGVGWTHVTEDSGCQRKVAAFMNDAFQARRLPIHLKAYAPETKPDGLKTLF